MPRSNPSRDFISAKLNSDQVEYLEVEYIVLIVRRELGLDRIAVYI